MLPHTEPPDRGRPLFARVYRVQAAEKQTNAPAHPTKTPRRRRDTEKTIDGRDETELTVRGRSAFCLLPFAFLSSLCLRASVAAFRQCRGLGGAMKSIVCRSFRR